MSSIIDAVGGNRFHRRMADWLEDADALQRLLDPCSVPVFLRDHFNSQSLFVEGTRDKFAGLIDPERILRDAKWGPLARHERTRAGFRDASGEHREITIRTNEYEDALAAGMTVLLPDLPSVYPEIAALVRRLRTALLIPDKMAVDCFVSPPGSGYGLHYDPCSIWVVQLAGSKRWRISERPGADFPKLARVADAGELQTDAHSFHPSRLTEHRLRPGDLLYLPPAAWHDVRAETMSVHLSITHFYRPLTELFTDLLGQRLEQRSPWRHLPTRGATATPAEARAAWREQLRARVEELKAEVAALDVESLVESLRARIDTSDFVEQGPPRTRAAPAAVALDMRLAYNAEVFSCALDPARDPDEALCLYHRGRLFATLPASAFALLDELRRRGRFSARELVDGADGHDWEELRPLLSHLLQVGALDPA